MSTQQFKGILGIWSWPIVNIILALIYSRAPTQLVKTTSTPAKAKNIEEWVWTDYRGKERRIVVHRQVEASD
jgi:hypothetical protein